MSAAAREADAGGVPDFLRDPIGLLSRRWKWMLGAAALATCLLVPGAYLLIAPTFSASATVLINSQQIPEELVRTTVQEDSFESINALVGAVLARERLTPLLEKHDLYPKLRETLPIAEVLEIFRSKVVIEEEQGIGRQARNVTARLFLVTFSDPDPVRAADVANSIADALAEASFEMRRQKAALTTEFLRKQLADIETGLRAQERAVTDFKERYRGELPSEMPASIARLERLQQNRQSLSLQIAEAETRMAMLASGEIVPRENTPEARLADLRARYAEQSAVHTDEHPNVTSLRRQIEQLEAELGSRGGFRSPGLAATTDRTLAELRAQLAQTDAQIADLDQRVSNTHQRAEQLAAYEQKVEVQRASYLDFLHKVQEAELAENLESAQQGEHVSVLERAAPPTAPDRARATFLALAFLLSLAIGVATGVVLELFDPVVSTAAQIEARFDLPVLGSVPRIAQP